MAFNILGVAVVYALQRLQGVLPLNPAGLAGVSADSAFNTAMSVVTNTNWQADAGETTMGYLTQMLALAVQNFFSAATGIVVVVALVRGVVARTSTSIGNFWLEPTQPQGATFSFSLPLGTPPAIHVPDDLPAATLPGTP